MKNPQTFNDVTLESIALQKAEVLKKLRTQKSSMVESSRQFFTPIRPTLNKNGIMGFMNNGLAIFDGVMIGVKIIRGIRKIFR